MKKTIGIRREDKNEWEKRVPLIPNDVKYLKEKYGIVTIVQPSNIRIYSDEEYREAGAVISDDLSEASLIVGVKEMPKNFFEENKTYIFFSHTIKGQSYNMALLRKMVDTKINLIDYERIVDENNRRLIFFGRYAGLAGMIETFYAYGQKLKKLGYYTPFEKVKQAYQYKSLEDAKEDIKLIGEEIEKNGYPSDIAPLIVGFAGYGNVSRGAQEIFDLLPFKIVSPYIIDINYENFTNDNYNIYKVIFKEEDLVELKNEYRYKDGSDKPDYMDDNLHNKPFDLQDYYDNPYKYKSKFESYLQYLTILVNCIYWTEDYPRLVTKEYLKNNTILSSNLTLKVIGDISCDINGSIEITKEATMPDKPSFTYFPKEDVYEDGVSRLGITVMSVDNLPCEFSKESSEAFSKVLRDFINETVSTDYSKDFEDLELPEEMKRGLILHNGNFTKDYKYMKDFLK